MSTLSNRYASPEMKEIWSTESRYRAERQLWLTILRFQSKNGVTIPASAIADYERAIDSIDLASIDKRERALRHDVKARIDEFNSLAGHELIHLGMTSRDLTETIEAHQILSALVLIRERAVALLAALASKANNAKELAMVARTHNVPAQVTTLGKRFASIAEELLFAVERIEELIARYPMRGIRGPVGTGQDMRDLIGDAATGLEAVIAEQFGFKNVLGSTGQTYPRSIDFDVVTSLSQLAAAPSNFATLIRLMSGLGLVSEGFISGQVGSSAMPHKMNARSCERINGLNVVLRGFVSMIGEISGEQWNEGDVSDSVVRRVAISDAFFAIDGIIENTLTVLNEMVIFPAMIEKELRDELPYLSTTRILMAAVKAGAGRESAHNAIKECATKSLIERREGKETSLLELLANDQRIPLSHAELTTLLSTPEIGDAASHVERVVMKISEISKRYPQAAGYRPGQIR